jgi:peptide-methionine (S)-S-oxide reductase
MHSFMRAIVLAGAGLMSIAAAGALETKTAIFSGGCFWCLQSDFDQVEGVLDTTAGYTGGHLQNPRYEDIVTETTGHREAVKVTYDPSVVSYRDLLTAYWHSVDATDAGGQFCDRGESYTTAIWVDGPVQRALAEVSKQAVKADLAIDAEIVTPILDAAPFYTAEAYHQDYHEKNPQKYQAYRTGCGRNMRVEYVWGENAYLGISR